MPETTSTARRLPAPDLRDGDVVWATGRWQRIHDVRPNGNGSVRYRTDRGGECVTRGAIPGRGPAMFDVIRD